MSADYAQRLVTMANQIATAFDGQRGDAAHETANHIKLFWSPPMLRQIRLHLEHGGEGLTPTARQALAEVAAG